MLGPAIRIQIVEAGFFSKTSQKQNAKDLAVKAGKALLDAKIFED